MLATLLCFGFLVQREVPGIGVIQSPNPDLVEVEAVVKLPALGPHERAAMTLVADCLLADTDEFGKPELLERTSSSGETIGVELLPDAVRVHFGLLPNEVSAVIPILNAVLHESRLPDQAVVDAKADEAFRQQTPWSSALMPLRPNVSDVSVTDVRVAYQRFFTPENFTIEVAVPPSLAGVQFSDDWRARVHNWTPAKLPTRLIDKGRIPVITDRPGRLTSIVLRYPIPEAQELDAAILVAFALGSGKGASVFKALREGLGWSYRQEAPLLGVTASGKGLFEQTVAILTKTTEADFDHAKSVKPALLDAIAHWTEADRSRALSAARTLLIRHVGMNPLYFLGSHPTLNQTFLNAYWRMKTGHDFDAQAILDGMGSVNLATLQATATTEITQAGIEVIRGKD